MNTYSEIEHGTSSLPNLFPTKKTKIRNDFIGRNNPCPCKSGKKYKNCCLKKNDSDQKSSE